MLTVLILIAAAQTAPSQPAPPTDQKPPAKMECRSIMEPGSRIPSRVCRLSTEWQAMAKAAEDDMRNSRNQRTQGYNPE